MKKLKYKVIESDSCFAGQFADQVTEELSQGWQLYSHPFIRDKFICQALVKMEAASVGNINPQLLHSPVMEIFDKIRGLTEIQRLTYVKTLATVLGIETGWVSHKPADPNLEDYEWFGEGYEIEHAAKLLFATVDQQRLALARVLDAGSGA